jgi:sporulation protein YlmC with PRC-barrel domain
MTGVPVITKSGQALGKVLSFDLDVATGHLYQLHVKPKGIHLTQELLVPWTAILEMSETQVVVADGAALVSEGALAVTDPLRPTPTLMKES